MKLAVLLLVFLVACGDKKKPTNEVPPPTITCNAVGDVISKNFAARGKRATSDFDRDEAAKMGPIASKRMVTLCIDDKWSSDGVTCVVSELEKRGKEEAAQAEGKEVKPEPDQMRKCLTEAQIQKVMGIAPERVPPRLPAETK